MFLNIPTRPSTRHMRHNYYYMPFTCCRVRAVLVWVELKLDSEVAEVWWTMLATWLISMMLDAADSVRCGWAPDADSVVVDREAVDVVF
jgi:hypothetical protein